jgi:ketosteroid isomerase-like protein
MSLADRLAIHDLFVRYACALDDGDVATVVGCFTADAVLQSPAIGIIAGAAAIRDFAEGFAARRAGGAQFRHLITNLAVRVEPGGARAHATAYLLVAVSRDGGSRFLPPGRYECDLVCDGGEWRFARQAVFHDHTYALDES